MTPGTITARATVNLHGLNVGETALVDPTDPRVAALLQAELLIDEQSLYAEPQATEKPQEPEPTPDSPEADGEGPKRRARRTRSQDSTET